MSDPTSCPRCGATLPPGTPPDGCPRCLIGIGLERTEPGGETRTDAGGGRWTAPALAEVAADFPQLEILEILGQGGMGVVYKARQRSLDRPVALKILAVPSDAGAGFAERFSREARALASLSHASIVTVYDFGEAGGRFYLLMEYVDGANLHQLIRGGEIAPREALQLVAQICDALQFAHDAGIVHRDIKPENILVDRKGRVKIADFGLARILGREGEDRRLTGAQQVMGTAHYMAPEQIERPLEVDHRADIYSLGVVFYELLTGELPIGRFAPPSQKIRVDVRVDEVVLKTLEKEPQRRYQRASEIRTEVDRISVGPAEAEVPAGGRRAFGALARPGAAAWVAIAVVAAAFVALAFVTLRPRPARGPGAETARAAASLAEIETAARGEADRARAALEAAREESARRVDAAGLPFLQAAARGHLEGVRALLEEGYDVDAPGPEGRTALIEAVDRGHADVAALLLTSGAEVDVADDHGLTALIVAAARGRRDLLDLVLAHGAEVDAVSREGRTALIEAVDGHHGEIALALLERGARVDARDEQGTTALLVAAARGSETLVDALLERGADPDVPGPGGTTALNEAVDRGLDAIAGRLIAAGARPDLANDLGLAPLHYAAGRGRPETARMLIEARADLEARDARGDTPLILAVEQGHAEMVRLLLDAGADPGATGAGGRTALAVAAAEGRSELLELLRRKRR